MHMKQFMGAFALFCCGISGALAGSSTLANSGYWATSSVWSPAVQPGTSDDVSIGASRWVVVNSDVGTIRSLVLGNANQEGAINLHTGGTLRILNAGGISVLVAGPTSPYPSYYSHSAGTVTTAGDFVVGENARSGDCFFSSGTLAIAGSLKIGAQTNSGPSVFKINGGGGSISASSLEVGGAGKLCFDFLGGAAIKTLVITNQVTLSPAATLVVNNASTLVPGDSRLLIDGASLSAGSENINLELVGFDSSVIPSLQFDSVAGTVTLFAQGYDNEFKNYNGSFFWSDGGNWETGSAPAGSDKVAILAPAVVNDVQEAEFATVGNSSVNAALNLYPNGSLTLTRPGVSLIVGAASNGSGYPNYYAHAAGTLSTFGDFVLGANGAKVEAQFSAGSISVGGTLRVGSYQNSGPVQFELRGGEGSLSASGLEVGTNGKLVFDFMGGNSIKSLTVDQQTRISPGASLVFANASAVGPSVYTLVNGASLGGSFDQVTYSNFPASVRPRLWYDAKQGDLNLVVEPVANAAGPIGGLSRLIPLGPAGYSYGVATDGESVYYTDYNAQVIRRISNGVSSVVLSNAPAIYGLTRSGDKFYYVSGNEEIDPRLYEVTVTGEVWGTPRLVASGFIRVRQLFAEPAGTLLAAVEGQGRVVRINPTTGQVVNVLTGLTNPQAAVSDADGNIYVSEYGLTTGDGTPTSAGTLWKLKGNGEKVSLYRGWRLRGLALLPDGKLGLFSEADRGDRGNSSSMVVVDGSGTVADFIQGFDYAEFAATTSSGRVITTSPRDKITWALLPGHSGGSETPVPLRSHVTCVASVYGQAFSSSGNNRESIQLTGLSGGPVTIYVEPDSNRKFAGWIRMGTAEWPSVPTNELSYPDSVNQVFTPGVYAVPNPGVVTSGTLLTKTVLPHRAQGLTRWPMVNVGTPSEHPQDGFAEAPEAYLAYVEVQFTPTSQSLAWDGGAGADAAWSNPTNWDTDSLPGSNDDALLSGGCSAFITSAVGSVRDVKVGDANGNAALNVHSGGSLSVASLTVGSAENSNQWPSYYSHDAGTVVVAGDFVAGVNPASTQSSFSSGNLTIGGALKIGAGSGGTNQFKLRGGGGQMEAGNLEVGPSGVLEFDFLEGNSLKTLSVRNQITLGGGSKLKVSNAGGASLTTYVLADGSSLVGTFESVEVTGLPAGWEATVSYETASARVLLNIVQQTVTWDNGSGDNLWGTPVNWDPNGLPSAQNHVRINVGSAYLTTSGQVAATLTVGDAGGNAAFNVNPGAGLVAQSIRIAAEDNANQWPSYYSHADGTVTTTADFVFGSGGASSSSFFSSGSLAVGGTLRLGGSAGGTNRLELRGGGGAITANDLQVGPSGELVYNFLSGNSVKTLSVSNAIQIDPGSKLIVTSTGAVGPATYILIKGSSLSGAFSSVEISGLDSAYVGQVIYDSASGEVRLVVSASSTSPIADWLGNSSAPSPEQLVLYAIGGASGPNSFGEKPMISQDGSKFYLSAIVRTNDSNLTVVGQSVTSLSGNWSNLPVNPQGVASTNTNGVPAGCQRREFSVDRGTNAKQFLRLKAILQ
jgi:hypothetical protein